MRPDIFNADIAGEILDALGDEVFDATLTRTTPGARDPSNLAGGASVGASTASYACKGFVADYRASEIDGTIIRRGDRKVILLGASLAETFDPQPGDAVAIEGGAWKVINVERDPAGATFTCQARR